MRPLRGKPKFKALRRYSGWTYPDSAGWKTHTTGDNGYLELRDLGLQIQMRGQARQLGTLSYLHPCLSTGQVVRFYHREL
ncbi:hypothetical protein NDA01_30990 [Trichocoleus desertorum AS-A10]|uniref:hypothetical protein n=1 Tax=Trichocoleus desertorum TaxID=1481672 RepID=UPI003296F650